MILTCVHTHQQLHQQCFRALSFYLRCMLHILSVAKSVSVCVCVFILWVSVCVWEEVSSNPTKGKVVKTYSKYNATYDSLQWLQHNIPTCYETRISAVQKIPLLCICFEMVSLCIAVHTNIPNRAKSGLVRAGNEENVLTKIRILGLEFPEKLAKLPINGTTKQALFLRNQHLSTTQNMPFAYV